MRRIVVLLGLASVVVGCASMENRMVYYPARYDEQLDAKMPAAHDVTLTLASEKTVHARWQPHDGSQGAILYCHGNAGNLQSRAANVQNLQIALGESVLIFDYPGYGKSQGTPSELGCYDAALAAYQWLVAEKKIPPERIILYGESLGGAVAVELATKNPHSALVLERTFTSLPDVADYQMPLFPGAWVMTNRFDSLAKIPQCRRPIFIAAADKDAIIPFRQAEQLRRACTAPAQLFVLKGLGHNDSLPTDFYPALRSFLAQNANVGWGDKRSP